MAAVRARTPYFDAIAPKDPNRVGQAQSWTATPSDAATPPAAWDVTVEVGWGDCPAGCIDRHQWRWRVASEGTVTFVAETGPGVPDAQLEQMAAAATTTGVGGRVTAGPVCPVQRPSDPACDPRPVAGAVLVVKASGGSAAEVARSTTDASGMYRFTLAPGAYTLDPQPVQGLMGTARPAPVTVANGSLQVVPVEYDTGIR